MIADAGFCVNWYHADAPLSSLVVREDLAKSFIFCPKSLFTENSAALPFPCDADSTGVGTVIIANEIVFCFIAAKQFG